MAPSAIFQRSIMLAHSVRAPRFFSSSAIARQASAAHLNPLGPWANQLSSSHLNRYLVVAEDHIDASANARRFEVRETHLEQAQKGKHAGRIELGGALLKKDFHEIDQDFGPGPHMSGSVLVVLGESIQDVRARVLEDVYVRNNVWDTSKIKIYPFLQAPLNPAPATSANASETLASNSDSASRAPSNVSLGQLRQDIAQGKGHKMVTLGALRKMHKHAFPLSK